MCVGVGELDEVAAELPGKTTLLLLLLLLLLKCLNASSSCGPACRRVGINNRTPNVCT